MRRPLREVVSGQWSLPTQVFINQRIYLIEFKRANNSGQRSLAMSEVANELSKQTGDLASFYEFIGKRLKEGDDKLSPEEALDIWRSEHPDSEEFEDTVAALREALEEMDAGNAGIPAEQFFREFREHHGLPPKP
jgi:hypothetical protein